MIQVEIPNSVSEYKAKFIAGLTGKQVALICFAGFIIFLDFKFLKPYLGDTIAIGLAIIPAFFAAAFGWVNPYGMPFDKFFKSVVLQSILAPKVRKAKNTSFVIVPCDKNYVPIPDSMLSEEVLEHVKYVREQCGIKEEEQVIVEKEAPKKKKFKKLKKRDEPEEYVSPKAIP